MKMYVLAAAAVALWAPSAHAVTQDSPAEADAEAEGQTSTNNIVCRRVPPPTGSRLGARRICRTEAQWGDLQRETRNTVDEAFNRSKAQDGQ